MKAYIAAYTTSDGHSYLKRIHVNGTIADAAAAFKKAHRETKDEMVMTERMHEKMRPAIFAAFPSIKEI